MRSPRAMTKSALALAREALGTAEQVFPAYAHPCSPRKYTQHQVFAVLVVREFFGLDYRGMVQLLSDWSDLRQVIGLKNVPHYSTLCYAERRLLKKLSSANCSTRPSVRHISAA